jgi:hypothetical protein
MRIDRAGLILYIQRNSTVPLISQSIAARHLHQSMIHRHEFVLDSVDGVNSCSSVSATMSHTCHLLIEPLLGTPKKNWPEMKTREVKSVMPHPNPSEMANTSEDDMVA